MLIKTHIQTRIQIGIRHVAYKDGEHMTMFVGLLAPVFITLKTDKYFRNATVTIQIFSLSLTKKAHELKMEKKKADALTYQMLPRSIAKVICVYKGGRIYIFDSKDIYL